MKTTRSEPFELLWPYAMSFRSLPSAFGHGMGEIMGYAMLAIVSPQLDDDTVTPVNGRDG